MKKAFLFSFGLVVAFASLFFTSCSEENDDNNGVVTCTVSATATDGGSVSIENYSGNTAVLLAGNTIKLIAVPDDGYQFIGWYIGDSKTPVSTELTYSFIANKDVAYVAKFEKSFDVSVRSSGNGNVSFKDTTETSLQDVLIGTEVTVVATPAESADFVGWFIGDSEEAVSSEATFTFTVKENISLVAKFVNYNGHEYVDLGLPSGLKWATHNVGASKPEEYGGYYAWGETSLKPSYNLDNSVTYGLSYSELKSCSIIGSDGNLTAEYDAARANWGGDWRMPTKAEQDELRTKCTWQWTTLNGVNGYNVTGPNGNSIFLPAAGYRSGTGVSYRGDYGYYWSGSLNSNSSGKAFSLYIYGSIYGWDSNSRYFGHSVRPVSR